jgi:hypothetical protein
VNALAHPRITAESAAPNLTEHEIAQIVAAGGGRYVGLLRAFPGKLETVVLFAPLKPELLSAFSSLN